MHGVYDAVRACCGGKLRTDSDRSENHVDVSKGMADVHSVCFGSSSILSPDFGRVQLIVSVGTRCGAKFHTDSNRIQILAKMS